MLQLGDVTYLVRDLDEAIAFFVEALGFEVRSDEVRSDEVRAPEGQPQRRRVVVGPDGGGAGFVLKVAPESDALGRQAGGGVAFFLRTDDFAAQHARMLAHRVTFREAPRHEPYGTVAVFEDPYGQPWDLIEPSA
ncbi:VOC family protein [Xylanimonas ulmi]|uniref:Putative glyoxalase superfamily protein PhnB n=1 Tax=Xylanimonas ulmi TaxID=228973 RepID=A0A4Q7M698_9MICO|nr:VOC family protein [Xylanibacterium ulmi]RZS62567.1 putative glyoxalase superfamily protein PhnB [Xylanibacterium ulmi]